MTAVEVHAVVEGPDDAPVLLLSNSLGSDLSMWDPQLPALTERFRVVRYDTRGHGRSPSSRGDLTIDDLTDDVVALLDRLGVAQAHVAGVSIGGMTGLRLAVREPQRVATLAVLCSSAHPGNEQSWRERAHTARAKGTGALAETVVGRWFTPGFAAAHPDLVARMRDTIAATPDAGYASCCAVIAGLDLRGDLSRISAPTLVVSGEQDPSTPPALGEAIHARIAGSAFEVLPGVAHMLNIEAADRVTPRLAAFLAAG